VLTALKERVQNRLEEAARLCSRLMEREINVRQMLHLIHAQLSFAALVLAGGISPLVAVLLMTWFAASVYQCAKALR